MKYHKMYNILPYAISISLSLSNSLAFPFPLLPCCLFSFHIRSMLHFVLIAFALLSFHLSTLPCRAAKTPHPANATPPHTHTPLSRAHVRAYKVNIAKDLALLLLRSS